MTSFFTFAFRSSWIDISQVSAEDSGCLYRSPASVHDGQVPKGWRPGGKAVDETCNTAHTESWTLTGALQPQTGERSSAATALRVLWLGWLTSAPGSDLDLGSCVWPWLLRDLRMPRNYLACGLCSENVLDQWFSYSIAARPTFEIQIFCGPPVKVSSPWHTEEQSVNQGVLAAFACTIPTHEQFLNGFCTNLMTDPRIREPRPSHGYANETRLIN